MHYFQDTDEKEEDKQSLDINKDLLNNEAEEETKEPAIEENKEIENTSEAEEIIEFKTASILAMSLLIYLKFY